MVYRYTTGSKDFRHRKGPLLRAPQRNLQVTMWRRLRRMQTSPAGIYTRTHADAR
ncbi:hypothetical protein OH77DRAFT_1429603 [Trametes cingulata]|nr:hypothetical protein OH77DRAFT_1429603 [Trametes cingulata]